MPMKILLIVVKHLLIDYNYGRNVKRQWHLLKSVLRVFYMSKYSKIICSNKEKYRLIDVSVQQLLTLRLINISKHQYVLVQHSIGSQYHYGMEMIGFFGLFILFVWTFSLRCGQTLISRLIQSSLEEADQSQVVHGERKIYPVWSSLVIIAEHQPQLFHQVLTEQIQVRLFNSLIL